MVYSSSQLSDSDKKQIELLVNNAFGQGYFNESIFLNQESAFWFVEKNNDEISGFSLILIQNKKDVEFLDYFQQFPDSSKFAYRKYTVVLASQRRKGLARKLTKDAIIFFTGKASSMYSTVWKHKSSLGIRKVLQYFNFTKIKDIKAYWREDNIQRKFTCEGCMISPCICNAELWIRQL